MKTRRKGRKKKLLLENIPLDPKERRLLKEEGGLRGRSGGGRGKGRKVRRREGRKGEEVDEDEGKENNTKRKDRGG